MMKNKKKRRKGQGKGSSFEREICKLLSRWWTNDKRDDVFWRTDGSGARAKTRSKTNQSTFGQCGDIQASDPIGQPLIDLCTIELKRGYKNDTLMDLLDKTERMKVQGFEDFILQARQDAKNADSKFWVVITRRNQREALVTIPISFYKVLREYHTKHLISTWSPACSMRLCVRPYDKNITKWTDKKGKKHTKTEKIILKTVPLTVMSFPLSVFLEIVDRNIIEDLRERYV